MDSMRVVIGCAVDDYGGVSPNNDFWAGTFRIAGNNGHQYMLVDYFRYYQLTHDCSNNVTLLTNTDLREYYTLHPGIHSNITLGNGSGSMSMSSGDKKVFRAVNTVTIYGDFSVAAGAEFTAEITPCN